MLLGSDEDGPSGRLLSQAEAGTPRSLEPPSPRRTWGGLGRLVAGRWKLITGFEEEDNNPSLRSPLF